jgi:hypothetical protein
MLFRTEKMDMHMISRIARYVFGQSCSTPISIWAYFVVYESGLYLSASLGWDIDSVFDFSRDLITSVPPMMT